jgi:hypothetical protein
MTDIFILNEIWVQGRQFACLNYFIFHLVLVLALKYNQNVLSAVKVRKVCYSLTELYVKCVYLNLFA